MNAGGSDERRRAAVVLGVVLVVSRVAYWAAGMRFDTGFADSAMQVLDRDILAAHPFSSAWYLHIQPPLFNLVAGIVFRLAGDQSGLAFQVLYLALTVALALNMRPLLRDLGVGPRWATGLTAVVVISPTVVQFENLLFYPHVEATLLVVAARSLQRWANDRVGHRWSLAGFAAALTALALGRSVYHPLWFVLLGCVLLVAARVTKVRPSPEAEVEAPAQTPEIEAAPEGSLDLLRASSGSSYGPGEQDGSNGWHQADGATRSVAAGRSPRPGRSARWALAAAVTVPMLAGTAVGLKNMVMFGWFTTSSLEGSNLLRMTNGLSVDERNTLLDQGAITRESLSPFPCAHSARDYPNPGGPEVDHPALDRFRRRSDDSLRNYNHRAMVPCMRQLRDESVAVMKAAPRVYVRHVGTAFRVLGYSPTPDIRLRADNREALEGPARVEAFLLGSMGERLDEFDPETFTYQPGHIEWVVLAVGAFSVLGLVGVVVRGTRRSRRARRLDRPARPPGDVVLAGFLVSALVLSMVITQFVESGENSRFRSTTDPLLIPAVALVTRSRRERRRAAAEERRATAGDDGDGGWGDVTGGDDEPRPRWQDLRIG